MDYLKHYNKLIENRQNNIITEGYYEKHHIIPRSMGGDDSEENLVRLTAREHYIAHLLLAKIHTNKEMIYALWMMQCSSNDVKRPKIKNSRMYEWARKEFKKYMSKTGKRRTGDKNSMYDRMWISNISLKENKTIKKSDEIPDGWVKGRNKWKPHRNDPTIDLRKKENRSEKYKNKPKWRVINDGNIMKHIPVNDPTPTGFVNGPLPISDEHRVNLSLAQKKRYQDNPHHNLGKNRIYKGKFL